MKKIGFYAYSFGENQFVEIQKDILRKLGFDVVDLYPEHSFGEILKRTRSVQVIVFNWLENGNTVHSIEWLLILAILRGRGIHLVPIMHNKQIHLGKRIKILASGILMKALYTKASSIIILSRASKDYLEASYGKRIAAKAFFIPHVNYIGAYRANTVAQNADNHKRMNVLLCGLIKTYKNAELIIGLAKRFHDKDIHFIIHGRIGNDHYREQITTAAQGLENLTVISEFVPDDEMGAVISSADILLLPYDTKTTLNSGIAILAFSNKKCVVSSDIPTIREYPLELNYVYQYQTESEQLEALSRQMELAYADWKYRHKDFLQKGEKLFALVQRQNSSECVANAYEKLLKDLLQ